MQAKRYNTATVGEPEIRNFSGSLDGQGATKGVFITTATFAQRAWQTAENISMGNKSIIPELIDGPETVELAQLMIRHGVGVVTEITYEISQTLDAQLLCGSLTATITPEHKSAYLPQSFADHYLSI